MKMTILIGLCVLAGCQPVQPKTEAMKLPDYEAIANDAAKASHLFMTKLTHDQKPGNLIPPQFWGQAITQLKPIRVEFDRVNVAIVMSETDDCEEGYYCTPIISSDIPVDKKNATFTNLSNSNFNSIASLSYYRKHKQITDLYYNTLDF